MMLVLSGFILGALGFGLLWWKGLSRQSAMKEELLERQQEKQMVVDFMQNMVHALGEGLSQEALFQRIVHAAITSTGALSGCIFELTQHNTLRGVAVEGLFPPHQPLPESSKVKLITRTKFIEQVLRSEEFPVGEGVVGQVALNRRGELIANAVEDDRIIRHDDEALQVRSLIAVPILFRQKLLGVLAVCNPADGSTFSPTDFSLLQSLADQAGLAVHNNEFLTLQMEKRQMDVDLALARSVQLMLLPGELPRIHSLDANARYISAQKVGGDLYDVFELGEGRLGVAVADVSGKGVSASILMAVCRTNLRHFAKLLDSPAEVLRQVNQSMVSDIRQDMYITMIYAVIDLHEACITFARAGHEMPLHSYMKRETGVFHHEMIASEGMPVGMVDPVLFNEVIEDCRIEFGPGDIFVLYTDGVTEACNEDEKEFSAARLADVVKTLRNRSCTELNDGILQTIERFTGSTLYRDDLTLVTLKRLS